MNYYNPNSAVAAGQIDGGKPTLYGLDTEIDVLPAHTIGGHARQFTPEQRLMLAVLEDAWREITTMKSRTDTYAIRMLESELGWLNSRSLDNPFAFECICSALGLDPGAVRAVFGAPRESCGRKLYVNHVRTFGQMGTVVTTAKRRNRRRW